MTQRHRINARARELKEKYEEEMRVYKAKGLRQVLFDQKVTIPGSFTAKGGGNAVACSYKAYVGLLFPLERGFTFVPRPPVSIRFDEVITVQFSRGTGAQRSFDFEVETRNGLTHTFTSIDRNEYHQLYDFVSTKKLRVKNIESEGKWCRCRRRGGLVLIG
ncbi:FACT complex subunit SSRP1 [Fasciola gigantica]|uniref:FACT complex subunit SSRP1 n=1 Tax=Fasciola gigantica TaxID=46835 RepID=A0A504YAG8_FASGI|nr:FACT complex subunit SSRP1 [Fasciola gigantica]